MLGIYEFQNLVNKAKNRLWELKRYEKGENEEDS